MTNEELIKKCIKKDHKAWDLFIRRYSPFVKKSVRYKLGKYNFHISKHEYMDIVQEVFLDIWEKDKLRRLRAPSCLKGWLAILSLNATSNYCRKRSFKQNLSSPSISNPVFNDGTVSFEDVIPDKKNIESDIHENELKEIIKEEMCKFSSKQRLALKLNIFDGHTQKNISSIMNIPEGTVATLLKRGKDRLQKRLRSIKYI